ncbi:MAG: hypothetical protein ACKVRO_00945 [Micropepsaceae bacterium]
MLDRVFAFMGALLLLGLSGIAIATSVEVQSVLMLFATMVAFNAIAGSNKKQGS